MNKLETAGFQAYAVGGCVRDSILGKEPDDWDLTTDARPEEVKALFPRTVDTGLQHGTVTVLLGGEGYEVTTYRIDGSYSDGRHPDSICFTPSLAEDLKRRDFTINAMAVSERGELVDLFGGQEDLARGCIRCVGDPYARFREDALRMLRAVRFAAQLNFEIEAETFKALTELSPNLARVSKERILAELTKLLLSNHPEKLELLYVAGLAPEMAAHFPGVHLDSRAARLPRCKALRFAAAGERITPEALGKLLTELKSDRATRDRAVLLLTAVHKPLPESETEVRRCLSDIGHDAFTELLLLKEAGYGSEESTGGVEQRTERIAKLRALRQEIAERGDCLEIRGLALGGAELLALGIPKGPALGACLRALLHAVLEEPARNETTYLSAHASAWLEAQKKENGGAVK
ncbi:CCA tRNA nucleotidyltransferase [Stomatobaculum longum]|uniref:CCA tRNA nucleotidyltransferase n=1 Tax=Stomatobaculum longum TaxID=796942 RepID=UPI0028E40B55|nr:CCA tRNA nucleotidyltransferase [Stomatobaculum longum]